MKREETEARAEALIAPILEANGFELWDLEYVKEGANRYLRAYIDKPGGITIDDCELVSRAFETELDREDFIKDAYILEISSPGLGRTLKKERDFLRSIGEEVEIRFYTGKKDEKETEGILREYNGDSLVIEDENGEMITLKLADIARVRLALDF